MIRELKYKFLATLSFFPLLRPRKRSLTAHRNNTRLLGDRVFICHKAPGLDFRAPRVPTEVMSTDKFWIVGCAHVELILAPRFTNPPRHGATLCPTVGLTISYIALLICKKQFKMSNREERAYDQDWERLIACSTPEKKNKDDKEKEEGSNTEADLKTILTFIFQFF